MSINSALQLGKNVRKRITAITNKGDNLDNIQEQSGTEQIKTLDEANTNERSKIKALDEANPNERSVKTEHTNSPKQDSGDDDDYKNTHEHSKTSLDSKKIGTLEKCCNKLFASDIKYELHWREFICFSYCLQVPMEYIVRHIDTERRLGALFVLGIYIVSMAIAGMPIYMVYMFMANYSKKAYISFWDCVPFFKGLPYSIVIMSILSEFFNIAFSGMALMYLKNIIGVTVPWINCSFPHAHFTCKPLYMDHAPYNNTCCNQFKDFNCSKYVANINSVKYGARDYYGTYMLRLGYERKPIHDGLLWNWVFTVELIWFLNFIFMSIGIRRFRSIMASIHCFFYLLFIPAGLATVIASPSFGAISDVSTNTMDLFEHRAWIQATVHSLERELPTEIVTFSALSKSGILATVNTVCIYCLKIFCVALVTVWVSMSVKLVQHNYNVKNSSCIEAHGDILIFAVLPDIFSRWYYPQIWLVIYFALVSFWGFSTSMYVLNSFLEALLEEFPALVTWRIIISALLCTCLGITNALILKPNYMEILSYFVYTKYIHIKVALLLISLIGLSMYSEQRFRDDYHFTTGTVVDGYWMRGVKIAFVSVSVMTFIAFIKAEDIDWLDILAFIFVFGPTIIGMIITSILYVSKINRSLIDPDPRWGPFGKAKKIARVRFDPTHELRFRSDIQKCKHSCLIYSSDLKKTVEYWDNK